MEKTFSRKLFTFSIILISLFLIAIFSIKLFSMRTHDPNNPRSRPNGYLMSHTVTVKKSPEEVFHFITYQMAEHNLSLAEAHEKFWFIKGDSISEGAVFVAEEYMEDEGVKNTYVVQEVIPDRLIYFSSAPTLIYEKRNGEWEQTGSCNVYVYLDIEDSSGNTRLTQTIVIEMHNFFTKFLIDLIIMGKENNEWMDHLIEELESLKTAIEHQDRLGT